MVGNEEKVKTKNVLYRRGGKSDAIGNGRMDTRKTGWGSMLADGIRVEIEKFGIPMEFIHDFSIDDNGQVTVVYGGKDGVITRTINIVRSEYEITDNQLRNFLNTIVEDISEMVLERADNVGYIYPNKIFNGEDVGLLEDRLPTCLILKKVTGKYGICEKACYGGSESGFAILASDCRRCNIPQLFPSVAVEIIISIKRQ